MDGREDSFGICAVLADAARRGGTWLGLNEAEYHAALGADAGSSAIAPGTAGWYRALALIHVAIRIKQVAGSQQAAQAWLRGPNSALGHPPIAELLGPGGPGELIDYLIRFDR